ncbi:MAG: hypothetical protein EPN33_05090 [Acidobacteria bacterium]|nr:MAG: hypothetical protein EPN33_05090 [Acidobacteriota bacterium]
MANFNGNNQFSSVSGFAPTYDLDGDLLDNPLSQTRNAYAWDAEGRGSKARRGRGRSIPACRFRSQPTRASA